MKYIIANWKENKNSQEVKNWCEVFLHGYQHNPEFEIIISPSFPFIPHVSYLLAKQPTIKLSSQYISEFAVGSHTGEVSAQMIKEYISYTIVGHSERRIQMNENNQTIANQIKHAHDAGLKTLLCVRDSKDIITTQEAFAIVYEPVDAIGSSHNAPIEEVMQVKRTLPHKQLFMYGGSAAAENINIYLKNPGIDGVLVGGACLDPHEFLRLIQAAQS